MPTMDLRGLVSPESIQSERKLEFRPKLQLKGLLQQNLGLQSLDVEPREMISKDASSKPPLIQPKLNLQGLMCQPGNQQNGDLHNKDQPKPKIILPGLLPKKSDN